MSGKRLRIKDLIPVKFTLAPPDESDSKKSLVAREQRFLCAISGDVLSNNVRCAVLRHTGDVVTMTCVDKIIRKDYICPLTNKKLSESDIIPLQHGGTGYVATTGDKIKAKQYGPNIVCG